MPYKEAMASESVKGKGYVALVFHAAKNTLGRNAIIDRGQEHVHPNKRRKTDLESQMPLSKLRELKREEAGGEYMLGDIAPYITFPLLEHLGVVVSSMYEDTSSSSPGNFLSKQPKCSIETRKY